MYFIEYCTESDKQKACVGCLPCDHVADWEPPLPSLMRQYCMSLVVC